MDRPDVSESIVYDVPSGQFTQVSSNASDACAIRSDGSILCWGYSYSINPELIPPDGRYAQVTTGQLGGCAVTIEGTIHCWEYASGKVSDIDDDALSMPSPPPGSSYTQVSIKDTTICGLKNDGTIVCSSSDASIPDIPDGKYKRAPVANSCAIGYDDRLVCWMKRLNSDGDLVPFEVPVSGSFTQVDFDGMGGGCALRTNGDVACWDSDGTVGPSPPGTYQKIVIGGEKCGLDTQGNVICWDGGMFLPAQL
jgi:hypothetical protein